MPDEPTLPEEFKELGQRIEVLEGKAATALEALESGELSAEEATKQREELTAMQSDLAGLMQDREKRIVDAERKAMTAEITDLRSAIEDLRKPAAGYRFAGGAPVGGEDTPTYGPEGEHSYFFDVKAATRGDNAARERLNAAAELEGKAMVEGTGSAGGFLVPKQISADILDLRFQRQVARGLFSSVNVTSNKLEITSVTSGLTAGWVAELATKPQADFTFGQFEVSVFTAAGLAVVSNQLLQDSRASVDTLAIADIGARLGIVEEVAFLNGSGTGQPLGVLNTPGVDVIPLTSTAVVDLLDAIQDAITAVHTDFLGPPNAIVMHPRTWGRLVKARETASPTTYIIGPPGQAFPGRRPQDRIPGYGAAQTPRGDLFGLPVYTTANVPINLGAGTNQSAVIVADWTQGLILDRQGITTDESSHVYFTTNQTVYRSEERVGFTAARYPKAFKVVGGAGLANG